MRALLMTAKKKGGWQPWANTLLYFPLENNAIDIVNNVSLTSSWTTNYTTVWGVQSAEFTKSNWLSNNNVSVIPQWDVAKTLSVRLYTKWSNQGWQGIAQIWSVWAWNVFWLWNYKLTTNIVMTRYWSTSNTYTPTLNTWTHIVVTYNNSIWKMYANWNLVVTWNTTAPTSWYNLYIGQNVGDIDTIVTYYWNISRVILELGEWTAQEVLDYYNATKDNYPQNRNSNNVEENYIKIEPTEDIHITPNKNDNWSGDLQKF